MRKSIRQKLVEKLHREHGLVLDPMSLVSYRRNGYGSYAVSWSTIENYPTVQSFYTMSECIKFETILRHPTSSGYTDSSTINVDILIPENKS